MKIIWLLIVGITGAYVAGFSQITHAQENEKISFVAEIDDWVCKGTSCSGPTEVIDPLVLELRPSAIPNQYYSVWEIKRDYLGNRFHFKVQVEKTMRPGEEPIYDFWVNIWGPKLPNFSVAEFSSTDSNPKYLQVWGPQVELGPDAQLLTALTLRQSRTFGRKDPARKIRSIHPSDFKALKK